MWWKFSGCMISCRLNSSNTFGESFKDSQVSWMIPVNSDHSILRQKQINGGEIIKLKEMFTQILLYCQMWWIIQLRQLANNVLSQSNFKRVSCGRSKFRDVGGGMVEEAGLADQSWLPRLAWSDQEQFDLWWFLLFEVGLVLPSFLVLLLLSLQIIDSGLPFLTATVQYFLARGSGKWCTSPIVGASIYISRLP